MPTTTTTSAYTEATHTRSARQKRWNVVLICHAHHHRSGHPHAAGPRRARTSTTTKGYSILGTRESCSLLSKATSFMNTSKAGRNAVEKHLLVVETDHDTDSGAANLTQRIPALRTVDVDEGEVLRKTRIRERLLHTMRVDKVKTHTQRSITCKLLRRWAAPRVKTKVLGGAL